MPVFTSAATRAVLNMSRTGVPAAAAAGDDAAHPPLAMEAQEVPHSDSEEEHPGSGDFDLSLFGATFRSGSGAEQLIDVWSQFAMHDEGSFFDAGGSMKSGSGISGALTELEIHQGVAQMTEKKLHLLLGMLEAKGLVRKFVWQGQIMWRKR
jgi:hypothetical protein